jgi:acetoin utilization deacetylase AcuC-like enzyme
MGPAIGHQPASLGVWHHAATGAHRKDGHPERPGRSEAVLDGLRDALGDALDVREPVAADDAGLLRVHPAAHLARLRRHAADGRPFDGDTYVVPASERAARLAVGGALAAVDEAVAGRPALSALRPPGHHAEPERAMGFCLLATAAVAVRHAQAVHGIGRVAVLDWDVHHGNGTQAVFWEDPSVLVASLHAWPFYPGTGAADERGAGRGFGTTLNVPLPPGTDSAAYLRRVEDEVLPAVDAFRPELVVVSCGFDAHAADPLGALDLEAADFGVLAGHVRALCGRLGTPPPVVVLEGGYDLDAVRASAAAVGAALILDVA